MMQRLFCTPLRIEKRTIVLLLMLFSLSSMLLTACGSPGKSKVTLTVMASPNWIKEPERVLAQKFETQTGIHIDYQIIPADNYFQVLKTKLNSGQGPDIFGGQSGVSDLKVNYNVEANAVDLSNEGWVKQEDPAAVAQSTVNGKVYGQEIWDIYSGYWVIDYNKDIFQKVGITSVPTTFDEFVADSAKIKAAGITPIYEPISDGWHHVLWFPEIGAQLENLEPGLYAKLNANQTKLASNQHALTAMTQINELYHKGFFGSNTLSDQYANTQKQMASGKFAMTINDLTLPSSTHAAYPNTQASSFGFFPIPILDNQLLPTHPAGPTKFIWSKGSHITEAKKYLAFLAQPENLQYLIDNEASFTTLDFTGVKAKWTAEQQAFLSQYKAATPLVLQDDVNYVNPQWIDMGKDMVAMFTGQETPNQVLTSIDTRRTQEAVAAKDPAWP
ncbi:MAG: carbohydrate ABC transporter substrate-binding protein [Ktedonobacterales bacterium]|nr:carbohydrate ABC transporter substrate-binding protein [Ktedonobacteraceae bacterium]MBA3823556.1 carbohydrate ABC transporter substrate-binding protein [Ktedonobacterales bacterium]